MRYRRLRRVSWFEEYSDCRFWIEQCTVEVMLLEDQLLHVSLLCPQTNRLACYSFTGAPRRWGTSGSRLVDGSASSASSSPGLQIPQGWWEESRWMPCQQWVCVASEECWARGIHCFKVVRKPPFALKEEPVLRSYWLQTYFWGGLGKELLWPCILDLSR